MRWPPRGMQPEEVRAARKLVDQARFELASANIDRNPRPPCSVTLPAHPRPEIIIQTSIESSSEKLGTPPVLVDMFAFREARLRRRKHVGVASNPHIEGWQQEHAHDQGSNQATNDDDGEGALRVGADSV